MIPRRLLLEHNLPVSRPPCYFPLMLIHSARILPIAARHPFDITPEVILDFRDAVLRTRPSNILMFYSGPRYGLSLIHMALDHAEDPLADRS